MKKILAMALCLLMMFSFSACQSKKEKEMEERAKEAEARSAEAMAILEADEQEIEEREQKQEENNISTVDVVFGQEINVGNYLTVVFDSYEFTSIIRSSETSGYYEADPGEAYLVIHGSVSSTYDEPISLNRITHTQIQSYENGYDHMLDLEVITSDEDGRSQFDGDIDNTKEQYDLVCFASMTEDDLANYTGFNATIQFQTDESQYDEYFSKDYEYMTCNISLENNAENHNIDTVEVSLDTQFDVSDTLSFTFTDWQYIPTIFPGDTPANYIETVEGKTFLVIHGLACNSGEEAINLQNIISVELESYEGDELSGTVYVINTDEDGKQYFSETLEPSQDTSSDSSEFIIYANIDEDLDKYTGFNGTYRFQADESHFDEPFSITYDYVTINFSFDKFITE